MVTETEDQSQEIDTPSPVRRVTVYVIVIVTVLLAVTLITVTGIRWMIQPTPSSIVVIQGDASLVGASIYITREGEPPRQPVTIGEHPDGRTPLFLETGAYTIRVEKDRKTVFRTDRPIFVAEGRQYDIDLTKPATPPSTRP